MDAWDQFPDAEPAGNADPWAQFPDAQSANAPSLRADGAPLLPGEEGYSAPQPQPERSLFDRATQYVKDYASGISRASQDVREASGGNPMNIVRGTGESLLALGSGAVAPVVGSVAGMYAAATGRSPQDQERIAEEAAQGVTYEPRTPTGKTVTQLIGATAKPAAQAAEATGADVALLPLGASAELRALAAAPGAPRPQIRTADEVLARSVPQTSVGAAASAPGIGNLSPPLRQAVVTTARKTGGVINPKVLERHIDAESLPVPVRITEGHATQDPTVISHEMNLRGQSKELTDRFSDINRSLAENIKVMRDEVGPDVFTTNATGHGDTLIAAYKAKDAAAREQISAKYKALADANGGNLPVDGATFVNAAAAGLKKEMKAPFLPGPIKQILLNLRKGEPMTIESFENLRTALAAEGRKADRAGDGNAAAAVSIVRDALESVPMTGKSAQIKALADDARKAAKARFDELRADPAYKAAVDETVDPDKFVQKFVIGGSRDNVAKLAQAMSGDEQAQQTLRVAVLDHLRDRAGLSPGYEGNFAAAGYNKALRGLDPKLRSLLPAETVENVEKLGRVAGYTTAQPKGSFVNNSNTFVAQAADYGASAAGHAIDNAIGVPLVAGLKFAKNYRKRRAGVQRALEPGAGLGRLEEPRNAMSSGESQNVFSRTH